MNQTRGNMYHWASLLLTETVNKTEQRVSVGIHCGSTCGSSHLVSWGDCGRQTVYRQSAANFGLVNFAWRPHYYCIYHTQVPIIIIFRLLSYLVIKYGTNKYFRTYWYLVPANTFHRNNSTSFIRKLPAVRVWFRASSSEHIRQATRRFARAVKCIITSKVSGKRIVWKVRTR